MVLLLLLLMPLWGVTSDTTKQTLSAMCGDSILFQVNVSRDIEITSIFWSHKGREEKRMVAIVKPDQLKVFNPRFLNRLNNQQPSFSLKLSNLTEEDGGTYEAQIFTDVDPIYRYFKLQVHAKNRSQGIHWTWCNIPLIISLGIIVSSFNAMT